MQLSSQCKKIILKAKKKKLFPLDYSLNTKNDTRLFICKLSPDVTIATL